MSKSQIWLIQFSPVEIERCWEDLFRHDVPLPLWPPADRGGTNPQVGDRLVLWKMGPGDVAGAVALGIVGEVGDMHHRKDYGDPDDLAERMRRSVRMRYTHWFESEPVRRVDLRGDPRFKDFVMFKPGGAQGANPWALTEGQWDAIQEAVPEWSDFQYPESRYRVSIEAAVDAKDGTSALNRFREVIQQETADRLNIDARIVGSSRGDWDKIAVTATSVPRTKRVRLVTWERTVYARTAENARWDAFRALEAETEWLERDDVRIVAIP